jgi:hypothetical protein
MSTIFRNKLCKDELALNAVTQVNSCRLRTLPSLQHYLQWRVQKKKDKSGG